MIRHNRAILILLATLLVASFFLPMVSAKSETLIIPAGGADYVGMLGGSDGDEWEIDLVSATSPVNLKIVDEIYYSEGELTYDDRVWGEDDVTSGSWTWNQNEGDYYLYIENLNDDSANTVVIEVIGNNGDDNTGCMSVLLIFLGLICFAFISFFHLKQNRKS